MSWKRQWSSYEDETLKKLYQGMKLGRWSLIAQHMESEFQLIGRTGKECRERYMLLLDSSLAKDTWTLQHERLLIHLHDTMGNKWGIIAHKLGGRTDNCVKNHFYSKMRKAMRKINKIIKQQFKKELKQIKLHVLYKIIQASEEKFKSSPTCDAALSQFCCKLKNKIIEFSFEGYAESSNFNKLSFFNLLTQVHQFNKNYKRKPKNLRRGSGASEILSPPFGVKKTKSIPDKEESQGSQLKISQELGAQSQDEDVIYRTQGPNQPIQNTQQIQIQSLKRPFQYHNRLPKKGMIQEEEEIELQNLMEIQNYQKIQHDPLPEPNILHRAVSEDISHMDLRFQDNYFFQDSEMEMRHLPLIFECMTKKSSIDERLFH